VAMSASNCAWTLVDVVAKVVVKLDGNREFQYVFVALGLGIEAADGEELRLARDYEFNHVKIVTAHVDPGQARKNGLQIQGHGLVRMNSTIFLRAVFDSVGLMAASSSQG